MVSRHFFKVSLKITYIQIPMNTNDRFSKNVFKIRECSLFAGI